MAHRASFMDVAIVRMLIAESEIERFDIENEKNTPPPLSLYKLSYDICILFFFFFKMFQIPPPPPSLSMIGDQQLQGIYS